LHYVRLFKTHQPLKTNTNAPQTSLADFVFKFYDSMHRTDKNQVIQRVMVGLGARRQP